MRMLWYSLPVRCNGPLGEICSFWFSFSIFVELLLMNYDENHFLQKLNPSIDFINAGEELPLISILEPRHSSLCGVREGRSASAGSARVSR